MHTLGSHSLTQKIAPSMRGRGRGNGGSSTSHPHPQRDLNLSKKFQLKSMGERKKERTLTCLLSKSEKMGREVQSSPPKPPEEGESPWFY